jgi:hypothetical protein
MKCRSMGPERAIRLCRSGTLVLFRHRHLFLLENGAMGVGLLSEGLRAGDIIVRFSILPDEFALRPVTGVD